MGSPIVALGLPAAFAVVVLLVVLWNLRNESYVLRASLAAICSVATFLLLFILLAKVGVQ